MDSKRFFLISLAIVLAGLFSSLIGTAPQVLVFAAREEWFMAIFLASAILALPSALGWLLYQAPFASAILSGIWFLLYAITSVLVGFMASILAITEAYVYENVAKADQHMEVAADFMTKDNWQSPWLVYAFSFVILATLFIARTLEDITRETE
jgi:hypothetical protein